MKMTIVAAALAASGMALFTSSAGLAQPAPVTASPAEVEQTRAAERAVERHLAQLLRQKRAEIQEERAWALGLR
jgi:hypothetical protein